MRKPTHSKTPVHERLAALEHKYELLCDDILGLKAVSKDWLSTVGALPDDEITRRAFQLGRNWRKRQKPL